jgi:hypothetical protein
MKEDLSALWRGTSVELLKALHILTRDGKLNADSRRKLKQVQHLSRLIEPLIRSLHSPERGIKIVDVGAGKSYLGFILTDLVLNSLPGSQMVSIENRPELVARSRKLATDSGFTNMEFIAESIETTRVEGEVDLVTALHACDTATDDAISFGLRHGARAFALVPCCQAELAAQLAEIPAGERPVLARHALHRREFGSLLTNVLRGLHLSSQGYQVTVTELVGWEHSLKNELILAEKKSGPEHPEALRSKEQLAALMDEYGVSPRFMKS